MKTTYQTITINGVNFRLNNVKTVNNPIVFYKGIHDVYGRPSQTKIAIWESWANWFREINSHMFGVSSHNSNFFSISGVVTWVDEDNNPTEYYVEITKSNHRAWRVERG